MSEHSVRMSAYRLNLKPATKLVLLGIISRVDWSSMSGSVSAKSVADVMALSERTVRRSMAELEQLNLIERERAVTANGRNSANVITVKIGCQSDRVDTDSLSPSPCQPDTLPPVSLTPSPCQPVTLRGCQTDTTINQSNKQPTVQPTVQPSEEPKPKLTPLDWSRPVLQSSTPITNRSNYR